MKKYDRTLIGLEVRTYPLCKQWQLDNLTDYVKDLRLLARSCFSGAEQALQDLKWLSKFSNEYYGSKVKKGDRSALHSTDTLRKDCYNRGAQVRRDLYSHAHATGQLDLEGDLYPDDDSTIDSVEVDPSAAFDGTSYTKVEKAKPTKPQPVKKYTREQLEEFAKSRGMSISKKSGGRHE